MTTQDNTTAGDTLQPSTPLAVAHVLDGVTFELRPDGELAIEHGGIGLVRLTPRDTYALGIFMRLPSVVALLEAQNAARQTGDELAYQEDQAHEEQRRLTREQALEWLRNDEGIQQDLLSATVAKVVEMTRAGKGN